MAYFNQEWSDQNGQRAFPLAQHATKRDLGDSFSIPDSFLLGIDVPIHAGLNVHPEKFFLRYIAIYGTGFNIGIGYDDGTSNPPIVAQTIIAKATHNKRLVYRMVGVGDFFDTQVSIGLGDISDDSILPPGYYEFDYAGGVLDTFCIRPMINWVSGLRIYNGIDRSELFQNDIEFVAGSNMRMTQSIVGEVTQIRFDAIAGEGLNEDCICDGNQLPRDPIRTINGVGPNSEGNVDLIADDCINISAFGNGLVIKDTCAEPCCGCTELAALTAQLERLGIGARNVENIVNRLEGVSQTTEMIVLGSRIGDQGCISC